MPPEKVNLSKKETRVISLCSSACSPDAGRERSWWISWLQSSHIWEWCGFCRYCDKGCIGEKILEKQLLDLNQIDIIRFNSSILAMCWQILLSTQEHCAFILAQWLPFRLILFYGQDQEVLSSWASWFRLRPWTSLVSGLSCLQTLHISGYTLAWRIPLLSGTSSR